MLGIFALMFLLVVVSFASAYSYSNYGGYDNDYRRSYSFTASRSYDSGYDGKVYRSTISYKSDTFSGWSDRGYVRSISHTRRDGNNLYYGRDRDYNRYDRYDRYDSYGRYYDSDRNSNRFGSYDRYDNPRYGKYWGNDRRGRDRYSFNDYGIKYSYVIF